MTTLARLFILLGVLLHSAAFAADDDVAIAIVYDTSGSMSGKVKDSKGNPTEKFTIANRALESIVTRLEKVAASSEKKLQVGLFAFAGQSGKAVVPLAPFDPKPLRTWLADFKKPDGGTPLGTATAEAARALLSAKAGSRHVLVITDGENTIGPPPDRVMPTIFDDAIKAGNSIYFHFVAFDVNAGAFARVKKQGATLVSAADEKELNDKLTFILEEKILLEKE